MSRNRTGRKRCRFCRDDAAQVDYKDLEVLTKMTTVQGKMFSRRRAGNCAKHQRQMKRAVKQARQIALLPFVGA